MNRQSEVLPAARCGERGQATLELAALLIAFAALILGIVFIGSLSMADNRLLIAAKYRAESAARHSSGLEGAEFRDWSYSSIDPFNRNRRVPVPFTAAGVAHRTSDNSIGSAAAALGSREYSEPTVHSGGDRTFAYDYEWKNLNQFNPAGFSHDCQPELVSGINAFSAAGLVRGAPAETDSGYGLLSSGDQAGPHSSDRAVERMEAGFFEWFGIRIKARQLVESPAKEVYIPAAHRSE